MPINSLAHGHKFHIVFITTTSIIPLYNSCGGLGLEENSQERMNEKLPLA